MKLLEKLIRKEISKEMKGHMLKFMKEEELSAMNKHLIIGEYTVSIQCSAAHYCEPRITTELEKYTSMEMALWLTEGGEFSAPCNFEDFEMVSQLEDGFDGSVYGWVSVECLDKFVEYLESKEESNV